MYLIKWIRMFVSVAGGISKRVLNKKLIHLFTYLFIYLFTHLFILIVSILIHNKNTLDYM